ncbi:MAG: UDP-N-acetylmuramoyl-L-alanyl-D-glutamate--2,6-diaminopimelate ligase [Verrucomicrobiota bacterium]
MIGYLSSNYSLIQAFADPKPARRTRREALATTRIFKMAPKLSDYFQDGEMLAVKGTLDRPISGLSIDSRRVAPGMLFFALPGQRADGASFIDEAVSRGAVAIVTQKMPAVAPGKVTFIHVADARAALADVAQRFYKFPDRDMNVIGVTGTNGKTTVTYLLKHLLNGDQRVGLLGTISYDLGARTVPSFRTTPEALDIYGMMAQMRDAGCRQAVMEVSSHGIDQQRVRGIRFGAAVFTNLTRDHLDYHKTLATYFDVKTRLFTGGTGQPPKVSAINLDDAYGQQLADKLAAEVPATKVVTYGENPAAQVRAENVQLHFSHTTFALVWPGGTMAIEAPLVGRYNVSNLLAAVAAAWGLGRDPVVFMARIRSFKGVPGRMERIDEGQAFNVLVDYAHTDDALRNALGMLRPITPGRLLVVFGCGGNRDRSKRPLMTKAVQEFADFAFATSDNPRTEAIGQIFDDMRGGVIAPEKITWIEDRRRAINVALDVAKPGDCILIAGKGHESCQEFADTVFPFDDRQVSRELLMARLERQGRETGGHA